MIKKNINKKKKKITVIILITNERKVNDKFSNNDFPGVVCLTLKHVYKCLSGIFLYCGVSWCERISSREVKLVSQAQNDDAHIPRLTNSLVCF